MKRLAKNSVLVCVLIAAGAAQAQEIDNTDAYALANQLADEVELVRDRMGRPFDDSPRLPVTGVTYIELYLQVQTLLSRANQLALELAGVEARPAGPVPSGEIGAKEVQALLVDARAQIRHVSDAIGIEERVEFSDRLTRISPTGIFLVVIDINRQLAQMLRVPDSDADVFEEISTAIIYASSLLAARDGVTDLPEAPPFDGYKRPADVYLRLTECIDLIIEIAPDFSVETLDLASRRNIADDTQPAQVLDIARLVTADLAAFVNASATDIVRPDLPVPRNRFATEVYAHAGILLRQLEALSAAGAQ